MKCPKCNSSILLFETFTRTFPEVIGISSCVSRSDRKRLSIQGTALNSRRLLKMLDQNFPLATARFFILQLHFLYRKIVPPSLNLQVYCDIINCKIFFVIIRGQLRRKEFDFEVHNLICASVFQKNASRIHSEVRRNHNGPVPSDASINDN